MCEVRVTSSTARPSEGAPSVPVFTPARGEGACPLDGAAFAALMARLDLPDLHPKGLAVAVSGGADSLALAHLAADWCRDRRIAMTTLGVDHALRKDSALEAARVGCWMAARGIAHVTLRWAGPKPKSAIQERARAARYALLGGWCRDHGVTTLLLAHHADDQAETALMRLARGGDVEALAAMRPTLSRDGLLLARPLLCVPSASLRATLRARGLSWIEDPSNRDRRYERVRVRRMLAGDGGAPLRNAVLAVSRKAGLLRSLTTTLTEDWIARYVRFFEAGYGEIALSDLHDAPRGLARRALARVFLRIGGASYPPRRSAVIATLQALLDAPASREGARGARTLSGCRLLCVPSRPRDARAKERATHGAGERTLLIVRETRDIAPLALTVGGHLFDRRFEVDVPHGAPEGRRLEGLGSAGWREVCSRAPGLKGHPIPLPARFSLPAVKDEYGVVAVPHLGYRRDWGLACLPVLRHVAGNTPENIPGNTL